MCSREIHYSIPLMFQHAELNRQISNKELVTLIKSLFFSFFELSSDKIIIH